VAIFIADVDHADILNPILREKGIRSLLGGAADRRVSVETYEVTVKIDA
jgi:hypothetical protein